MNKAFFCLASLFAVGILLYGPSGAATPESVPSSISMTVHAVSNTVSFDPNGGTGSMDPVLLEVGNQPFSLFWNASINQQEES